MLPRKEKGISESIRNPEFFFDAGRTIARAMGGSPAFFEMGAKWIHRVGVFGGLGWILPYGEAKDGIDYVRVTVERDSGGLYTMQFYRTNPEMHYTEFAHEHVTLIREVTGVHVTKIRSVYEENTLGESVPG